MPIQDDEYAGREEMVSLPTAGVSPPDFISVTDDPAVCQKSRWLAMVELFVLHGSLGESWDPDASWTQEHWRILNAHGDV